MIPEHHRTAQEPPPTESNPSMMSLRYFPHILELFVTNELFVTRNTILDFESNWRLESLWMAPKHQRASMWNPSKSSSIHIMPPRYSLSHPNYLLQTNYLLQETQFLILDRIEDQTVPWTVQSPKSNIVFLVTNNYVCNK